MDARDFQTKAWQYMNRVYIGQISAVREREGLIDVVFLEGLATKREALEIPLLGYSIAGPKDDEGNLLSAFQSSWIRYMPQIDDLVYVAFGSKGEAKVLGPANLPGGYKAVADSRDKSPSKYPRGDLVDLKQGEWDMRSSGGAYIHGAKSGALLLSAGATVSTRMDKQNDETRSKAGLLTLESIGTNLRIGDIKRRLPLEFKESSKTVLDPTATKEFSVHLENGTLIPTLIADESLGGVRDDLGAPRLSSLGQPLRYRKKIWSVGSTAAIEIPSYSEEIDVTGNHSIDYGLATVSVSTTAPAASISTTALSTSSTATTTAFISGTVSATLSSTGVATVDGTTLAQLTSVALAQVDALVVQLGTPVALANPAVHGTVLLTQLSVILGALTALAGTMAGLEGGPITPKGAAWTAVTTALTPVLATLAIPPGTPASLLSGKVFVE